MQTVLAVILAAAAAYLLGSVSFAVVVSKGLYHQDVRQFGSGNAGMTNILRTYGKKAAALTLAGDFLKGVAAVLIGRLIFAAMGVTLFDGAYVGGLFAILGHLYPVYFGFRGGKGILTSIGIIAVINPLVFLGLFDHRTATDLLDKDCFDRFFGRRRLLSAFNAVVGFFSGQRKLAGFFFFSSHCPVGHLDASGEHQKTVKRNRKSVWQQKNK